MFLIHILIVWNNLHHPYEANFRMKFTMIPDNKSKSNFADESQTRRKRFQSVMGKYHWPYNFPFPQAQTNARIWGGSRDSQNVTRCLCAEANGSKPRCQFVRTFFITIPPYLLVCIRFTWLPIICASFPWLLILLIFHAETPTDLPLFYVPIHNSSNFVYSSHSSVESVLAHQFWHTLSLPCWSSFTVTEENYPNIIRSPYYRLILASYKLICVVTQACILVTRLVHHLCRSQHSHCQLFCHQSYVAVDFDIRFLDSISLQCLRQILGIQWSDKVPNTDVLLRANAHGVKSMLLWNPLRWFGYVCRMDEQHTPKQLL